MKSFKQYLSEPFNTTLSTLADKFFSEFDSDIGVNEFGAKLSKLVDEPGNCAMISEAFIKWLKIQNVKASLLTGCFAANPDWSSNARS